MYTNTDKVKVNDIMTFVYWGEVEQIKNNGGILKVRNLDTDTSFYVDGKSLVELAGSADTFDTEEKSTKTAVAELLVSAYNKPFSVIFVDAKGKDRKLRGRLVKPEPLLGRSMVEDLDIPVGENRIRQVDHRTIKELILDGVKYKVQS